MVQHYPQNIYKKIISNYCILQYCMKKQDGKYDSQLKHLIYIVESKYG